MDEVIDEIRGLSQGWAGPNTRAPTAWMVENVRTVARRNLPNAREPDDVEVDPDDGTVTIHWSHRGHGQHFALSFQTRSKVIGVLTDMFNKTGYPPWRLPLEDSAAIQEKLEHPLVNLLITTDEHNRSE
jgi:hypothetical protein